MLNKYDQYIVLTVYRLNEIRDNPTPEKIENLLGELQTLTLIQDCYETRADFMSKIGYGQGRRKG